MCPWHPALEHHLPLCKWCPAWLMLWCLVLCSEMSGRELMEFSGTIHCPSSPLQKEAVTCAGSIAQVVSGCGGPVPKTYHIKEQPPLPHHPFEWKFTILEGETDHKFNLADSEAPL